MKLTGHLIALLMVSGLIVACNKNEFDIANVKLVELMAENTRISEQLSQVNSLLQEVQASNGTLVRQQIIVEPAVFSDSSETLQNVIDRKILRCGGNADLPGFGYLDPDSSEFVGFDIDICRAIGAAVLGPDGANQVEIIPLTSKLRFATLQTGAVDVLTRNTTWTMSRDSELRADYAGVTFYDGQGILVRKSDNIKKISSLNALSICVQAGSTSHSNVDDYFQAAGYTIEIRAFDDRIQALQEYEEGACDAYTGDKSSLVAQRSLLAQPKEHIILSDEISREPLGPVVRHNDDNWKDVVSWTLQCLLNAESLGISHHSVEKQLSSESLAIKRLLGSEGELGDKLGLRNDFCYQVINQVGNYRDVYERHLGPTTDLNLPRGLNALYSDGGILYPLPFK